MSIAAPCPQGLWTATSGRVVVICGLGGCRLSTRLLTPADGTPASGPGRFRSLKFAPFGGRGWSESALSRPSRAEVAAFGPERRDSSQRVDDTRKEIARLLALAVRFRVGRLGLDWTVRDTPPGDRDWDIAAAQSDSLSDRGRSTRYGSRHPGQKSTLARSVSKGQASPGAWGPATVDRVHANPGQAR